MLDKQHYEANSKCLCILGEPAAGKNSLHLMEHSHLASIRRSLNSEVKEAVMSQSACVPFRKKMHFECVVGDKYNSTSLLLLEVGVLLIQMQDRAC